MEYQLKNGETVTIRVPTPEDAAGLVHILTTADTESPFLIRNPGEFDYTEEQEASLIQSVLDDPGRQWYVAEYHGKLVGQCSAALVNRRQRCLHRGMVGFVLLKECWNLGIGSKMMENCLAWCREQGLEQVELEVVAENERALHMYKGFGFAVTGTRPKALKYPDGSYADEYFMIKYL